MNYGLYLAKIVGVCSNTDSRLQIKILPQMESISDDMCPKWPYFFRDEILTGAAGDLVWCICDNEFNNGYVLGLANYNTYSDDAYETSKDRDTNKDIYLSLPDENLKKKIQDASIKLLGSTLSFQNVKVTHWDTNSIHMVERDTGGFVIAFAVGSMFIMRPQEFIVHIGGATTGTSFKMDAETIGLKAENIKLQSEKVGLGSNPTAPVLVTNGPSFEGSIPSKYAKA